METAVESRVASGTFGGDFLKKRFIQLFTAASSIAILTTLFFCATGRAAENQNYRRLAEHYAPVIYQETKSSVLDYVTKFDYDGDWNGANNWRNAYLYDLPGYVYYAVIESTNHYFITYSFFHARDYTAQPFEGFAPKTEHENDMEGCTLTIEKDGTPYGRPILLETLAHDHFYTYANTDYRRVESPRARLDGSIVFLDQSDPMHPKEPAIYIESEGHGVRAGGTEVRQQGYSFPGVIYRLTGRGAEVPKSNQDPDGSYDLVSIEETLWAHRFDVGTTYCCSDSYTFPNGPTAAFGSSFNGPIGGCAAKPPWGWDQADDSIVKGDWFRDPLKAYRTQLQITGFDGAYVWNPYLEIVPRSAGNMCTESTTNKDVQGALTSSLIGIARALTSGGTSRTQVGDSAKQLFLGGTALMEWARDSDFQLWNWDKTLAAAPSIVKNGLTNEMRIPLLSNFAFSSPAFKVSSRYFDSIIMKYKCSLDGATARVYWTTDGSPDFTEQNSASIPVQKTDKWVTSRINLSEIRTWDKAKSIVRLKIEVVTPGNVTVATIDPNTKTSDSPQFVLNLLVFDRDSFSDTFER